MSKSHFRLFILVTVSVFLNFNSLAIAAEVSCECLTLKCDVCSIEKGVTFYTEKCGPKDSKVKSCGRPTCLPIQNPTEACPNPPKQSDGPTEPIVVKAVAGGTRTESVKGAEEIPSVGKIKVIQGSASIVRADGKKTVIEKEDEIREGDRLDTAESGAALVTFKGGNKIHVHSNSAIEVQEYKNPHAEQSRKALLRLIKGKVRNQVKQKYSGETSYYQMRTKTAVAGVRGTDFVMEYYDDGSLETKLEALGGKVQLASSDEKEAREVKGGQGVIYRSSLDGGKFSDVYDIPPDKLKKLDRDTRLDLAKAKTSGQSNYEICKNPNAFFDQCAWHCEGNPTKQTQCRTDLAQVKCVRKRCNGNGEWAEATTMPNGKSELCPPQGYSVKACDY